MKKARHLRLPSTGLFVASLLWILPAPAQIVPGAPLEQSFVFRDCACLLAGAKLAVVNVAPASPQFVSHVKTADYVSRLDFDPGSNQVYAAVNSAGVQVFDWSAPCNLSSNRLIQASTGFRARYVELAPGRLYFSEYGSLSGPRSWNLVLLSTGTALSFRNTVALGGRSASTAIILALPNQHVAVSLYADEVRILDATDPSNVLLRSALPVRGVVGMVLKGDHLHLLTGSPQGSAFKAYLETWDITSLATPTRCSRAGLNRFVFDGENNLTLKTTGGSTYAFIGGTDGMQEEDFLVVDLTDCTNASQVATLPLQNSQGLWITPADLDAVGDHVYVSGWKVPVDFPPGYEYYLAKVDISPPNQPELISTTSIPMPGVSAAPRLRVTRQVGELTLGWELPEAQFHIEATDTLSPPVQWSPLLFDPLQADQEATVSLVPGERQRYYRLRLSRAGPAIIPEL